MFRVLSLEFGVVRLYRTFSIYNYALCDLYNTMCIITCTVPALLSHYRQSVGSMSFLRYTIMTFVIEPSASKVHIAINKFIARGCLLLFTNL